MGIMSGLVLYAVIWFLSFLVVIPFRLQTQGDLGEVVDGTHASSPAVHHLRKKAWITTAIAAFLWVLVAGVIFSGAVTVADLEYLMYGESGLPRPSR